MEGRHSVLRSKLIKWKEDTMHMPTGLSLQWTNSFYFHTLMGIKTSYYISTLKLYLHQQKCMPKGHMLHCVPQTQINVAKSSDDFLADMYAGEQTESWERPTPNAHWESREAAGETDGDIHPQKLSWDCQNQALCPSSSYYPLSKTNGFISFHTHSTKIK